MISVYAVTGDDHIIDVAKVLDTQGTTHQIESLLSDPDIGESNTSVVLNAPIEQRQFELRID